MRILSEKGVIRHFCDCQNVTYYELRLPQEFEDVILGDHHFVFGLSVMIFVSFQSSI